MQQNRWGTGAGVVLIAAALTGCGSSQTTAEELAPERTAPLHTSTSAQSAGRAEPSTSLAANADSAENVLAPAEAQDAVGPESAEPEAPRPIARRRARRAGAAVNSRTTLPVTAATTARESEGEWTRPFPISRAGIRWDGAAAERSRVFRRRAITQAPASPATAADHAARQRTAADEARRAADEAIRQRNEHVSMGSR